MTPSVLSARLVVVTGPIAAGKSTVSELLTRRLLEEGLTVACLDVDEVARMMHAPGGLTEVHWAQAHRAHGWLVAGWLDSPVDVVISHGSVSTPWQTDALMSRVPAGTSVLRAQLLATFEAALSRVVLDPERGLSKDPTFLRRQYDRYANLTAMDPADLTFDTETETAAEIVAVIAGRLLTPTPG
ncbi:MAG: adenylyl-sulfate kinase [Propionibacteriaceae bacterium]